MLNEIKISDYDYPLPEESVAKFPLEHRDDSRLLVHTSTSGESPVLSSFKDIARFLPSDGVVVFNETKVVPARMFFQRSSGAIIEVFCLEPETPSDYQVSFASKGACSWKAIVGNLKKWKGDTLALLNPASDPAVESVALKADLVSNKGGECIVRFTWNDSFTFSEVLSLCGEIPIPPYLKRRTELLDAERYQTCYARFEGSVAAPTAGLHFTGKQLDEIASKGLDIRKLSLHVGAGTFLPVKGESIVDHTMHSEPFEVQADLIRALRDACGSHVVAVGTTSARTLESLYYLGVHCIETGEPGSVSQWEPYREKGYDYSTGEALTALLEYMESQKASTLLSRTQIIIVPGFEFRIIDYLVTNFHQPRSTLLLLISAFIGDSWRMVYNTALESGFRFLSYGDSSLLQKRTDRI